MQRNWQIVRRILKELEEREDPRHGVRPEDIVDFAPEVVSYHIRLMIEAGLVRGECSQMVGTLSCWAYALTWDGHEFLDKIREDRGWSAIVRTARDKGLSLSFEVIKAVAGKLAEAALG